MRSPKNLHLLIGAALLIAALIAGMAGCHRGDEPMPPQVGQLIRQTVEVQSVPASLTSQKEQVRAWEELRHFYRVRQYQPAWSDSRGLHPRQGR